MAVFIFNKYMHIFILYKFVCSYSVLGIVLDIRNTKKMRTN